MIMLVLLLSAFIRFINIDQSLWLDEAINVFAVKSHGYRDLIINYSLGDFHPPLYHVILKITLNFFPNTEIFARLPSIIFGVATVFILYLLGKKLFERKTAAIAAILLATSPLHIYYSQEARMYSLAAFLVSLSVYFFVSLLKKETLFNWFGFVAATSLMLYSDYLPYLMIPTYIAYLFFFRKSIPKPILKTFFPAFLLIFLFISPWISIFPQQLQTGLAAKAASPAWANVVGSPSLKSFILTFVKFTIGRISFANKTLYALMFAPGALYVLFLFIISPFRMSRQRIFLYFWLAMPILLGFAASFFIPVFSYFRFLFLLPAFYLIWSMSINSLNWPLLNRSLLAIALSINVLTTSLYLTNKTFQREDWKGAIQYLKQYKENNSITIFESDSAFAPFEYYNKYAIETGGALDSFSAQKEQVEGKVTNLVKGKNQVFLFQYLSGITDPQGYVFERLTQLGYANSSTKDFPGVGFVYEFKNRKSN